MSMTKQFKEGDLVERNIDGIWFLAVVKSKNTRGEYSLKYCDDGNLEESVIVDDLRIAQEKKTEPVVSVFNSGLLKPLSGLIEDDAELRKNHVPRATVHNSSDIENAIIINGCDSRLAVGGGLRALRYLRPT